MKENLQQNFKKLHIDTWYTVNNVGNFCLKKA